MAAEAGTTRQNEPAFAWGVTGPGGVVWYYFNEAQARAAAADLPGSTAVRVPVGEG